MIFLAAAALFAVAQPAVAATPDIRVIRSRSASTRYVRVYLDTNGSGVRGTEVSLYDLHTGRSTDRVTAGPLSFQDGFDGRRGWGADVTGMAIAEENADAVRDTLAAAHFFGRRGPEQPAIRYLAARGRRLVLRLRYPALSGPIDVTLDRASGFVVAIDDRSGIDATHVRCGDYRTVGEVTLPFTCEMTTRYGIFHERVRRVEFVRSIGSHAFDPPPPPRDVRLDGITTVPMTFTHGVPVVPIRINGGPVLRVLFDSGASNDLKPAVARRLGLQLIGTDKAGGIGLNVTRRRYTTVARLQIGAAELTNQPFTVIDDDTFGPTVDGVIGCEVLQRFGVRFDFANRRVDLTRDLRQFGIGAPPIPMRTSGCAPEVDGSLDGMRGSIAIDTGSGAWLDVMAPFVRSRHLVARYHVTTPPIVTGTGVGGESRGYIAIAHEVRLGPVIAEDVPIGLAIDTAGAFNDPSELGNAGVFLLRNFVTVFDYRSHRMWLLR